MKGVTVRQIQRLDEIVIRRYGIPSLCLMENAGRQVAFEVLKLLKKKRPKTLIFCGPGNNGGDGFVAARYLLNAGIETSVWLIGPAARLKSDAAVNFGILKHCGCRIKEVGTVSPALKKQVRDAGVIVDAIFGVGLNRDVGEPFRSFIELIRISNKKIVSVDIPSGLDGTTGGIYGVCVKASTTVTFTCPKVGFYKTSGPRYAGKVVVADIGIPLKLKKKILHGR